MASYVNEYLNKFYDFISDRVQESTIFSALLQNVEDKTGIPGPYIVTGITTCFLLCIVIGFGPAILMDLIVVAYPAYRSFQALEARDSDNVMYWIKYWIVFGMFKAGEHIGDLLFWWFPGYMLVKFLFLVWCFAPVENNGSVIIYENYIRSTFLHHAETVDNVIRSVKSLTNQSAVQ